MTALALFVVAAPLPDVRSLSPAMEVAPPALAEDASAPAAVPDAAPDAVPQAPAGEIVVTADPEAAAVDPLARINVETYEVTQKVDDAVIGPTAKAYRHTFPEPVRDGLRNVFRNLREPIVAINDLLQLHPGRSIRTLARFTVNTTVGAAGLVDMAKRRPFGLPGHPNSLADTLGYYGVKPGPYLFLPLIGPTTVRDLIAGGVDRLAMPVSVGGVIGNPAISLSASALRRIDRRDRASDRLDALRAEVDPYTARRDAYLAGRQAEIDALHGKGPAAVRALAALDP